MPIVSPSITLESACCLTSFAADIGWTRPSQEVRKASDLSNISFRRSDKLFGAMQSHWLLSGRELCLSKAWVAASYSDSVRGSFNYMGNQGYHPLEEVKVIESRKTMLTPAVIARTTAEANNSALLVFPGMIHCEPHGHITWDEFQYIIDDYGDIFFEIFDDENILQDRDASNPVNLLIGMDIPMDLNGWVNHYNDISDVGSINDISFNEDVFEVVDQEFSDSEVNWGKPETSYWVHPRYFSKRIIKAIDVQHLKKMDHPSNGVSIFGCLRPTFDDEESYLRTFHSGDSDGYMSDFKDGEVSSFDSKYDGINTRSTIYKLEIMRIELFSVYGVQYMISLEDFQDAEPDILVHSAPGIIERFTEKGVKCTIALKDLCRKKGLSIERADLIGVDSLGMDVRVFFGTEAQTLRVPFKSQASSEIAAEKKIRQLLFSRCHRKKFRTYGDPNSDRDSF